MLEPKLHSEDKYNTYAKIIINNIEFLPHFPFDDNYHILYYKVHSSSDFDIVTVISTLSYFAMTPRWYFSGYKNIKIEHFSEINKNYQSKENLVHVIENFINILIGFELDTIKAPDVVQGWVWILDEKIDTNARAEKFKLVIFKYVIGNRRLINYLVLFKLLELINKFSVPDKYCPQYKTYPQLIKEILIYSVPFIDTDMFKLLTFESNMYVYPTFAEVIKAFFSETKFHEQFSEFDQRIQYYKDFLLFTAITKLDPLKISEFIKNNVEKYKHKLYSQNEDKFTKQLIDDYLSS